MIEVSEKPKPSPAPSEKTCPRAWLAFPAAGEVPGSGKMLELTDPVREESTFVAGAVELITKAAFAVPARIRVAATAEAVRMDVILVVMDILGCCPAYGGLLTEGPSRCH